MKLWNVTVWSIIVKGDLGFGSVWNRSSKFVSLTGGAEIVDAQGSDKDWYLTSWNK